jgi:predicted alpha/beta hydrolase
VVIAPATGVRKERYIAFARFLAGRGFSVLTFDYRGIGGSRGEPQQRARFQMRQWGECDVTAALDWCVESWAPRRLGYVGHSIGGQLLGLARNHHLVTRFVAVSAQRGYWPHWQGVPRLLADFFFRAYVPLMAWSVGHVPLPVGDLDDLPAGVALEWARWWRDRPYSDGDGRSLDPRFHSVTTRILALSFEDDRLLAPKRACDALFRDYYTNAKVRRLHLVPAEFGLTALGHSGIFQAPASDVFWSRLARWLRTGEWEESQAQSGPAPHRSRWADRLAQGLALAEARADDHREGVLRTWSGKEVR